MASKMFQNVINQMKDALDRTVGVVDEKGAVVASNNLALIGTVLDSFSASTVEGIANAVAIADKCYLPLVSEGSRLDYACFTEGADDASKALCRLISVAFNECKSNYDEKHNRTAFIKNIISDNILPGDVYVRAKELHFVTDTPRTVILVRQLGSADVTASEVIQKIFPDRQEDFVIGINETNIVVIKRIPDAESMEEPIAIAKEIESHLRDELGVKCIIGISTAASHLRELADRYKEAQVAIEVGCIFDADSNIIHYDNLGLGRIIYQLPTTLCEMFLNEVFKKNPIEALDEDTLETINKFFENNLNVSETSRKLYVHRNTLVYRLEKIKKLTGLDLREFDHAIVFKVAMMVKMYLDSLGVKN